MDKEELSSLLVKAIKSNPVPQIIVIDGFDEMIPQERNVRLWVLQHLLSAESHVKLFLSSRKEVEPEIMSGFRTDVVRIKHGEKRGRSRH